MGALSDVVGRGYVIAGGAAVLPALHAFLEKTGVSTTGNPDIYVREYRAFGINDARELRDRATSRAIAGGVRVFIVVTPIMTLDAQNALLKTLEEPSAGAAFFLVVPSPQTLIPTLRSRVHILALRGAEEELPFDIKGFLASSREKRIDMLKPLYTHDANEERDMHGAIVFLQALERELASQAKEASVRQGITAIYRARKYLTDKGALLKPLLEQVALLAPRM